MSSLEVRIPDIGDAEDVEVIEICVESGASVETDDALVVIESDKASMEVPAPAAGIVIGIEVSLGDLVNEGDLIAKLEVVAETPAADEPAEVQTEPAVPPAESRGVEVPSTPQTDDGQQRQTQKVADYEVRIPDIGDAEGVIVIEIDVSAGDTVAADDLLIVIESDKASMEIPSPIAGTVVSVAVQLDDEVSQGTIVAVITPAGIEPAAAAEQPQTAAPVLSEPTLAAVGAAVPAAAPVDAAVDSTSDIPASPADAPGAAGSVYAGPAVRRLARELGVDLHLVTGTGAKGRVVKDDVKAYVKKTLAGKSTGSDAGWPAVAVVDFSKFGAVEEVPLSRIRISGARNLHRSWVNVVHVTQHDEADVTDLETFRASLKAEGESRGVRLTPLPFLLKACAQNLEEFVQFNASLGPDARTLIVKKYVNLGFAVDTPDGLVVPVVRDVNDKGVWTLAEEIAELSTLARDRKLKPDQMSGGCFTVSSLGAIGGTGFTPIVNAPEVAILGVARLDTKPVWNGEAFEPRKMLPLSLSYDHRAINGAEGGRFMQALVGLLQDIRRFSL